MIKNSHKQAGSTHIVAVIILVIIIIGLLGFVFWQNFIYKEPVATTQSQEKESKTLEVKELKKTLSLQNAPYGDIEYAMTSVNSDDENKYVVAIYSKDLNKRLTEDQESGGTVVSSEYEKLSCNKAVYAYYAVYDEIAGAPGLAVDPDNLPENAKLYIDFIGPCSPSTEALGNEVVEFRDWVKGNLH